MKDSAAKASGLAHRRVRFCLLLIIYTSILAASLYFCYSLRFDFSIPEKHLAEANRAVGWIVLFKLSLLFAFGQFNTLLTYFRLPDLMRIVSAMTLCTIFLVIMWVIHQGEDVPPRGVIVTDYVISILLIGTFRTALRYYRERKSFRITSTSQSKVQIVGIIGAGDIGASVAADLIAKPGLGMRPAVFIDDDEQMQNIDIHGIPVVGTPDRLSNIHRRYDLDKLIIALPSSSRSRVRKIVEMAKALDLPIDIVPSIHELASGKVTATQLRPVQFEDLLGRDPVKLDKDAIGELIANKVVWVTGAGGSIGSELTRQIAKFKPSKLFLIDQSESHLFQIEQELIRHGYANLIQPIVSDIADNKALSKLFELYKPAIIFHTAAYKHVPMMEAQPAQALHNNTLATMRLGKLASKAGIEHFIFISTDKAINPTSVMGVSKRLAELMLQSIEKAKNNKTRFIAVRFGNVLGSSGSVIPIFKDQIAEGGPVTVTHPDVTRYFMTIPEASSLVLESAAIGKGGNILVLDMGKPIKIADVAKQLIRLSGLEPDVDIEIQFIGLRPGEKLYEELQHSGEEFEDTEHPSVFHFKSNALTAEEGEKLYKSIMEIAHFSETRKMKKAIKSFVPEYTPYID